MESIQAYNPNSYLPKDYSTLPCYKKIYYTIASLVRDFFSLLMIPYLTCTSKKMYTDLNQLSSNTTSQGLIVCIHGLKGHPSIWKNHIKEFNNSINRDDCFDLYVPFVEKKGDCSLDEAAATIYSNVLTYAQSHKGKPISLLGFSNGSRIATYIETRLRNDAPNTPVRVSTVAGVHLGSPMINAINRIPYVKNILSLSIRNELSHESDYSKKLLDSVRETIQSNVALRSFEFWASTNDFAVPKIPSSLPRVNQFERYHVLHGYGHKSVASAVAKKQIQLTIGWMRAINKLV